MQILGGFDESNAERRQRIFNSRMDTARKLNARIKHFYKEIDGNYSLSKGQKNQIKKEIINNL